MATRSNQTAIVAKIVHACHRIGEPPSRLYHCAREILEERLNIRPGYLPETWDQMLHTKVRQAQGSIHKHDTMANSEVSRAKRRLSVRRVRRMGRSDY